MELWRDDVSWGSHLPALLACLSRIPGPILELGVGYYSTPVLNAVAVGQRRPITSMETNEQWLVRFSRMYGGTWHTFYQQSEQALACAASKWWSVVLIDDSPGETRCKRVEQFAGRATFVIVHDWSAPAVREPIESLKEYREARFKSVFQTFEPATLVIGEIPIPEIPCDSLD